jgi:hypothetical protein
MKVNAMRVAFAAMVLIAFSASVVQSVTGSEDIDRKPKKVYEFVPFCADHLNDCQSLVAAVADEYWPGDKGPNCTNGIKGNEVATKSIVSWLARREETHAMSTKIGIRTAIRALWHC